MAVSRGVARAPRSRPGGGVLRAEGSSFFCFSFFVFSFLFLDAKFFPNFFSLDLEAKVFLQKFSNYFLNLFCFKLFLINFFTFFLSRYFFKIFLKFFCFKLFLFFSLQNIFS